MTMSVGKKKKKVPYLLTHILPSPNMHINKNENKYKRI